MLGALLSPQGIRLIQTVLDGWSTARVDVIVDGLYVAIVFWTGGKDQ